MNRLLIPSVFFSAPSGKVRRIVSECLACDALVVAGSRFSANLLSTLTLVKKRALVFWVVIIGNGVVYVVKPIMMPGRHFTEDKFILYGEYCGNCVFNVVYNAC